MPAGPRRCPYERASCPLVRWPKRAGRSASRLSAVTLAPGSNVFSLRSDQTFIGQGGANHTPPTAGGGRVGAEMLPALRSLGKRPGPGEAALPLVSEPIRVEQADPATPPRGQAYFRSDWTSPLPITAGASEVSANSKKRLVPICGVGSTRWWPIEVGSWRSPPLGQTLEQAGVARARPSASQSELGRPAATSASGRAVCSVIGRTSRQSRRS